MSDTITSFDYEPSANKRWEGRGLDIDLDGDPVDLMRIDPDNLEYELSIMGAIVAWYSEKYAEAVQDTMTTKALLERCEAQQTLTHRELLSVKARQAHASAEPKTRGALKLPTDKGVEASVKAGESFNTARMTWILAEVEQVKLKGRCEAARRKAEALTAIGMKRNSEARALSAVGRVS